MRCWQHPAGPGHILTQKAAIFADKVAVDEETVRLRSRLGQLQHMPKLRAEPPGAKLDFPDQEFQPGGQHHRLEVQRHRDRRYVVDIKAEIEKIREQVQNIE